MAELLKASRERKQVRRLFNRTAISLEKKLREEKEDFGAVEIDYMYLQEKMSRLSTLDEMVQTDYLNMEEFNEEMLTQEVDEADQFLSRFIKIKQKYYELKPKEEPKQEKIRTVISEEKRNFKLPRIEIQKYDDDPKKWIQFWGQFKKIHEDKNINEEDKFQYLLQCLKEDSNARALVESFPPCAENYKKAVKQLTSRYGREEMLVEVYIRELLGMVLSQARGELILDLRSLYDRISTYLHALETLGVTKDRYDAMLFPLIESAMPEQILITWSRSQLRDKQQQGPERLAQLLKFLCNEVEAEERIRLARSDFNINQVPNIVSRSRGTDIHPTAACLATKMTKEKGKEHCYFCDRDNHTVSECGKGGDLNLEEKKELIKKKGGCYICLKKGHMAKQCKSFLKCLVCKRRHLVVLCPELHKPQEKEATKTTNKNVTLCQNTLTTLLQTLVAVIEHKGKKKKVRILLDSGSQRTYIKKSLAEELNLKVIGQEEFGHTLFGGVETKPEVHNKCEVKRPMRGRYEVKLLWKEDVPDLKSNYKQAFKRLQTTSKKLERTGELQTYDEVFQEWKEQGIIEEVKDDNTNEGHYLPHQPVIKMSSTTTRVRPVFDASAKDQNGWSLNDCIDKVLCGPHCSCSSGAPAEPDPTSSPPNVKRCRRVAGGNTYQYEGVAPGLVYNGYSHTWTMQHADRKVTVHCKCYKKTCTTNEQINLFSASSPVNVSEDVSARTLNMGFIRLTEAKKGFSCETSLKCKLIQTEQRNHHDYYFHNVKTNKRVGCEVVEKKKYHRNNVMWCSLAKKPSALRSFKRKRLKRSSDSRPELVYTFIEQAVQPGAQVALKCSAIGEPPPRFKWTLDGLEIPSHHGAIITEGRESGPTGLGSSNNYMLSTLSLTGARVEHGGRYECRATNAHGSIAHAARLNVYGSPYIRAMSNVKAVAGSDVTIWCPYYGFPIKSVKWEGGAGNDPRYQQLDGQMTITNVDRNRDKGVWTCSVLTPGGELAKREVHVTVVSPPVLSPVVFPPGLRAGDRAQLTCTVTSGDMPVYFSWLKDQMPISSILQVDARSAEFYSMLIFKSLTAAHSGVYTCVVTNTAGKANTSAELAIKVPPYWHIEPSDAAVLLNGSLTVSCEARGHPPPSVYWTKVSGSAETTLGGVSDPVVLSNGSLRLETARAEHSGKYQCRADNGVPPALSKTLNIHVNEPARFETPSANVTAKLGETIRLACVARGDSPLSTAWSHSGRPLPNSDYRMSISETRSAEGLRSELVVERADRRDSGVYRCQASNPFGRSDHFVHLAVQEPPEPPANFRVLESTSRSVRLQWRRPYDGNSPVLGYVVQYRRHDASSADAWRDADTHNVSVSAHPIDSYSETEGATISGLEPATAYLVRARTVTAQFMSAHTRALLALTLHEPPARAPISLRASAPRTTTIELAWQAPPSSSWNGELLGYTVWWWQSADGLLSGPNVGMEFATVRGQINRYTIEGLEHYTRYSVSVRAFNSAGAGPATGPVNTLTQESVPSEGPRAVRCRAVSPQSLKVEWSPPPAHAHHGALLGYKLLYRPEHTTDWLEWEVRGGGGLSTGTGAEVKRVAGVETLLLALRPHTNYTIQALAYTAAGDGVPAHPIHCTTQQDVPGPPAAVKVVATSVTSLAVSWLPPSRPNGPILYYTVFYRELGRDRQPQTTTIQADDGDTLVGLGGSAELRSLAEGATYEAWVSAHSATGEGEPSAPQPATTTQRAGARLLSFGVWTRVQCGHAVRLACVSKGEPAPRARWLRGDRAVTHDPRTHLTPHGHLAIYEVDASTSGNYTCSARNAFGSEEVTYRVECATPPSAPTLNLDHASHKEAKLTWRTTHHPAAPPHGFTIWWVRVRDDSGEGIDPSSTRGEEERRLEAGGEAASVVLRALSCGVTYSVRAVAHSRAGPSPPSVPLLVRTKPPVLVWEGGGEPDSQEEGAEAAVWSNSSALAVDARRAVRCGARLVRLQWRRADAGGSVNWRDADLTSLHHHREVVIGSLTAGAWYGLRLWTATESSRHQAVLYAATTTHSGERLRRPVAFQSEGGPVITTGGTADAERVLGAVSLAFAALAAIAVTALILVLLAKRSTLFPCGEPVDEETRRCSHSVASTDKSVCPEQQNIRNCQHDYKHDKLSPASDVYEISPYATFAVGGETTAATLDHTLQFRTFGHRDNDAPPHRPCRKHPQRHRERADVEKHHSDCELQQLSRYEKVRPRHCPGTSYCVPLSHHGGGGSSGGGGGSGGGFSEVYAGDSSAESGPGSLSPRTHHEHS